MNDHPGLPVTVTFFPDYRAANPVQSQLYDRLPPMIRSEPGALESLGPSQGRGSVFHLHWEDAVLRQPGATAEGFLNRLQAFRGRGGRVIWTIHNLAAHDPAMEPRLADLRTGLFALADVIHLHSLPAVAAARQRWDLPLHKVRVIAHPSYDGHYPQAGRSRARADLGLDDAGMVVLLPGRIAAYKQPQALVAAFAAVAGPQDRLLIAGKMEQGLDFPRPDDPRIILRPGHLDAAGVAQLHAAADLVVLPYDLSLTSGSALLAATLARGVLGPDCPGLRDAVEAGRGGILYPEGGLQPALADALSEGPDVWAERGQAARSAMAGRDPAMLAEAWADLILGLALQRVGPW
jgi:glycosyltransferase involved in cell wall biosynthesis